MIILNYNFWCSRRFKLCVNSYSSRYIRIYKVFSHWGDNRLPTWAIYVSPLAFSSKEGKMNVILSIARKNKFTLTLLVRVCTFLWRYKSLRHHLAKVI